MALYGMVRLGWRWFFLKTACCSTNTPPFMGSKGSLLCPEGSTTSPYPVPEEYIPHIPIPFLEYYPPIYASVFQVGSSLEVFWPNNCTLCSLAYFMFCLSHWSSNNEISYGRQTCWLFGHCIPSCFYLRNKVLEPGLLSPSLAESLLIWAQLNMLVSLPFRR
jgi:hypothetical protein